MAFNETSAFFISLRQVQLKILEAGTGSVLSDTFRIHFVTRGVP